MKIDKHIAFVAYVKRNNLDAYSLLLAHYYGKILTNYEKDLLLGLSREFKQSIK